MTRLTQRIALGLIVVGIAAAAVASVVYAARDQNTNQPPAPFMGRGRGGPGGPGGMMGLLPPLGRELQLTDSQRDQIKAIADSHRDEWRSLADRGRTAHEALNAAIMTDPIDEGLIRQKSSEVAAVEADLAVARAHARAEVFQLLTADQKAKVQEFKRGRGRP